MASFQPASSETIIMFLEPVASSMKGSWALEKKESEPLAPFLKHLKVSWPVRRLADLVTPTRTFNISDTGMIDIQILSGVLHRTQEQDWSWAEKVMDLPVIGSFPGFITFDSEGRLVTKTILPSNEQIVTVYEHVVREEDRLILRFRIIIVDPSTDLELVCVRRVLSRAA
jgi:hypothetical protein